MTSNPNLYDVGVEGLEIEALLREAEGELTPELEARLDAFVAGGKESIERAAQVVRRLEGDAATLAAQAGVFEAEAKRIRERETQRLVGVQSLKARMLWAVDAGFSGKVKTPLFTIWGQNSAAGVTFDVAPDADLGEVGKQHPDIVRTTVALDKVTLLRMHKAGEAIPAAITVEERPATRSLRMK